MKLRIITLMEFYLKYRSLADREIIRKQTAISSIECDIVFAFELDYIPDIIDKTLKRIKVYRPDLYQKLLNDCTIYIVSKSSAINKDKLDSNLEFRYSLSKLELILADNRTNNENLLNGIARAIYYKYIRSIVIDGIHLTSYFIKTTVLWLCEIMNLAEIQCVNITEELTKIWIRFACDKLHTKYCQHYFISNINILEHHNTELLHTISKRLTDNQTNIIKMLITNADIDDADEYTKEDEEYEFSKEYIEQEDSADKEHFEILKKYFPYQKSEFSNTCYRLLLNAFSSSDTLSDKQFWILYKQMFLDYKSTITNEYDSCDYDKISYLKFITMFQISIKQMMYAVDIIPYLDNAIIKPVNNQCSTQGMINAISSVLQNHEQPLTDTNPIIDGKSSHFRNRFHEGSSYALSGGFEMHTQYRRLAQIVSDKCLFRCHYVNNNNQRCKKYGYVNEIDQLPFCIDHNVEHNRDKRQASASIPIRSPEKHLEIELD
ncbi:unnamed protein product [Didymodactylos carnosus]|nr:unnamed protein product [Didymodactylos carnosus]CAF3809354.1 unnamed protein product [Didymodactylos carnosus]